MTVFYVEGSDQHLEEIKKIAIAAEFVWCVLQYTPEDCEGATLYFAEDRDGNLFSGQVGNCPCNDYPDPDPITIEQIANWRSSYPELNFLYETTMRLWEPK